MVGTAPMLAPMVAITPVEAAGAGVVLAVTVTVFTLAASMAIRDVGRLLRRGPRRSRRYVWLRRVIYALAGAGACCIAYAYFVEPYRLEVTHVALTTQKFPPGAQAVRIVHVSDLHCDRKARLAPSLPDAIAPLRPDVIVFTGDAANCLEGLEHFRQCMRRLAALAPTYAVRGNWDLGRGRDAWRLFEATGVVELNDEAADVKVRGTPIRLVGAPFGAPVHAGRALAEVPPDVYTVVLYHTPDLIYEVASRKADLYLAGHTHGGQVALPVYGALITLSRYGKRFEAGLFRVDQTHLYVNRGIGMEGGWAPRVRFCARPEITVLDIRPR